MADSDASNGNESSKSGMDMEEHFHMWRTFTKSMLYGSIILGGAIAVLVLTLILDWNVFAALMVVGLAGAAAAHLFS